MPPPPESAAATSSSNFNNSINDNVNVNQSSSNGSISNNNNNSNNNNGGIETNHDSNNSHSDTATATSSSLETSTEGIQAITERKRAPYSRPGPYSSTPKEKTNNNGSNSNDSPLFACRICLDTASEPVVTNCGHLFCYDCLMSWFDAQPTLESCPVCKSHCTTDKLVPIYGSGREEKDPRKKQRSRPRPKTTPASSQRSNWFGGGNGFPGFEWGGMGSTALGSGSSSSGLTFHAGFMPFFPGLGFGFQIPFGGPNPSTTTTTTPPPPQARTNNEPVNQNSELNPQLFFLMRIVCLIMVLIVVSAIFG